MGEQCVLLPGKRRWTISRSRVDEAVHEPKRGDSNSATFEGQLQDSFESLGGGLFSSLPTATGISSEDLLGSRVASQSSSSVGAAAANAASADTGQGNDEDEEFLGRVRVQWLPLSARRAHSSRLCRRRRRCRQRRLASSRPLLAPDSTAKTRGGKSAKPTKAAVGDDAAVAARGRGRPKRVGIDVTKDMLIEFEACDPDSKFFANAHNFRRAMERAHNELGAAIHAGGDLDTAEASLELSNEEVGEERAVRRRHGLPVPAHGPFPSASSGRRDSVSCVVVPACSWLRGRGIRVMMLPWLRL